MAKPNDLETTAIEKIVCYTHSSPNVGAYHAIESHMGLVKKLRDQGRNVGTSLFCGFHEKKLGRQGKWVQD